MSEGKHRALIGHYHLRDKALIGCFSLSGRLFMGRFYVLIQCVLVIRESFTREYGSRVFHSGQGRPLFTHFELNQLSLIQALFSYIHSHLFTLSEATYVSICRLADPQQSYESSTPTWRKEYDWKDLQGSRREKNSIFD